MGLLYGKRDLDQTIVIAMRGGMDSDCNPSSAAGVLATTMGAANLPERFTSELNREEIFSHTAYSFPKLIAVSEELARQIIQRAGGKIIKERGEEIFLIPAKSPRPSKLELSWSPGPIANSRFTPAEMVKITAGNVPPQVRTAGEKVALGWEISHCGTDMDPGLRSEYAGKHNVLLTHPLDRETGCVLSRKVNIPTNRRTVLRIVVAHDSRGDFDLIVRADGKELLRKPVNKENATNDPWLVQEIDLSRFGGKKALKLEVVNQPSGWSYEAAYWAEIALVSQ